MMAAVDNTIIQGILYDEKSSFLKGPRLAPPLIRKALHSGAMNYFAEDGSTIDGKTLEKGDFEIEDYFDIENITRNHLKHGNKLLTLGGDHSITYPILKAFNDQYPKIDILQIDAHPDLYQEYEGDPYSHACPFARIMEGGLVKRLVQVGIRTLNHHQQEQQKRFGVESYQMAGLKLPATFKFINPLYISLDMDAFDPAYAPGVSHREPGGLTSRQVIDIIRSLDANVVGADIVEYNPERDYQDTTAILAAKMMKEILSKMN